MEAARTLTSLPERMRRHRFTEACEELRPLGVAYVLRRFGGSLDRADAEDVVAEVIIRFYRLDAAGRPPDRLRPAFFQSVKNASLDLLRYRGVRPTAPLEAAAAETGAAPSPEEHAESHEDVVRLREAMARMRPNYREAIVLRFGLGLTVPEIAERVGISLPAAKKLVLRSTSQIRERMEAIDDHRFCPEMRDLARRSVLDGEVAEVAGDTEAAAIRAHLEHCGPCRGHLAALRSNLHELGGGVLVAGIVSGRLDLLHRLLHTGNALAGGVHAGVDRVRLAAYRAGGALDPEARGSAGLLAGTGQKIAAACTAGAAGAATCVATGIVGPGIGLAPTHHVVDHPTTAAAHVRSAPKALRHPQVSYLAPPGEVESALPEGGASAATAPRPRGTAKESRAEAKSAREAKAASRQRAEAKPQTASQTARSEFGFEAEPEAATGPATTVEAAPPVAESRTVETAPSTSSSSAPPSKSSAAGSSGGGTEEFGFGG